MLLAVTHTTERPLIVQCSRNVELFLGAASAYPEPGSGPDDLVYAAEHALQKAKNEGRNRVSVIRPV